MVVISGKEKQDITGFGQRLRALREARELSQEAHGKLCDPQVRYQAIARLERSEQSPAWPTVLKPAKAPGVGQEEFLPQDG